MTGEYTKPLPNIKPWTAQFWKAAAEKKLVIQRGMKTGKFIMYPKKYSPHDYSESIEWVEASGKGKIYSYTIVQANPPSNFLNEVPYVVAIVELEEGVRMCTNIVETDYAQIKIGASVEAVFETVADDIGLVKFKVIDQ
jgi:uncharacterized OB-fold protein